MENQIDQPASTETPPPESAYADPGSVLVIPRSFFNMAVVAIVFFGIGLLIGSVTVGALFNANSVENKALIDLALGDTRAIMEETVKNVLNGGGTALTPGERYEVVAEASHPVKGPADAPVEIIEFGDFHCQYCGRFFSDTLQPLLANYEGQIKFTFRDYPILGEASILAALGGKCANDQNAFWGFHDLTYADQGNLTREAFVQYAEELNLDVDRFVTCLDNQEHIQAIQEDYAYAQNLGVTGTPAFFINGRFLSGAQPYTVFAAMIDEELGSSAESTPEPAASS